MTIHRSLTAAFSRRALAAGSLGATALAAVPGLSHAQTPQAAGWTFTDDKGETIFLDQPPGRIAADLIAAAALWDFGVRPVAVFGWDVNADDTFNVAAGAVERDAVEVVGNVTTPFDLEKAVGAAPDLIVTLDGDPADPAAYWSIDPEIVDEVRQIAPLLAINSNYVSTDLVVGRFGDLAEALGADLAGSGVSDARTAFTAAETAFTEAVAANPDLTCLFIYPSEDGLFVANPRVVSDLIYFRTLGLVMPDLDASDTEYWETLSWEESAKYDVDLIFTTTRAPMTAADLLAHPVFGQTAAAKAGQIASWNDTHQLSYQGLTAALDGAREAIASGSVLS